MQPLEDVELAQYGRAMCGRLAVEPAALQVGAMLMQAVERVDEARLGGEKGEGWGESYGEGWGEDPDPTPSRKPNPNADPTSTPCTRGRPP